MRQLRSLARRRIRRRPPMARWKLFGIRALAMITGTMVLAATGWTIGSSSGFQSYVGIAWTKAMEATVREGFVVTDAFTQGLHRTDRRSIHKILEPWEMKSILLVDTVAVRQQIEGLPWIKTASVQRAFPSELRISVEEYRPVALWVHGGRTRLIDTNGAVVGSNVTAEFRNLIRVSGEGVRHRMEELFALLAVHPTLEGMATGAALIDERRWNIEVDNHLAIRLPAEAPEKAIVKLMALHEEDNLLDRAIRAVDLRNDRWIALEPMAMPATVTDMGEAA